MLTTPRLIALVLGSWLLASGCSNHATATLSPGADLSTIKSFYVVHQPKDTHQLQNLIRDRLLSEGYKATGLFGDIVRMEAGWIVRRATTGTIVWRESIISEATHSDFQRATEAAARNNIAQALTKISKLDL